MAKRRIAGFSDYSVDKKGRVWSKRQAGFWKELAKNRKKGVYGTVTLVKHGQKHRKHIHTLVLTAFCGHAKENQECRHLDGIKENTRLSNLRWGTRSQNYKDKCKHGVGNAGERTEGLN